MNIDGNRLASQIDDYCELYGIAKNQFSDETGISSATLSQWRTKTHAPSDKRIFSLEDYVGMGIEEFMSRDFKKIEPTPSAELESHHTLRENLRSSPSFRILFDAAEGATEADLLEAAALIARRKEERAGK